MEYVFGFDSRNGRYSKSYIADSLQLLKWYSTSWMSRADTLRVWAIADNSVILNYGFNDEPIYNKNDKKREQLQFAFDESGWKYGDKYFSFEQDIEQWVNVFGEYSRKIEDEATWRWKIDRYIWDDLGIVVGVDINNKIDYINIFFHPNQNYHQPMFSDPVEYYDNNDRSEIRYDDGMLARRMRNVEVMPKFLYTKIVPVYDIRIGIGSKFVESKDKSQILRWEYTYPGGDGSDSRLGRLIIGPKEKPPFDHYQAKKDSVIYRINMQTNKFEIFEEVQNLEIQREKARF